MKELKITVINELGQLEEMSYQDLILWLYVRDFNTMPLHPETIIERIRLMRP